MKLQLNIDQAHKINNILPKGYKLVTAEEKKKILKPKKKPKIAYVPISQVIAPPPPPSTNTRKKPIISYKQDLHEENAIKEELVQDELYNFEYKAERQKKIIKTQYYPNPYKSSIYQPPPDPPIKQQTVFQQKEPLTTKEIIGKLEANQNFYVVVNYKDQQVNDSNLYDRIVSKTLSTTFSIFDLEKDLKRLFLKMYEFYPSQSSQYIVVTKLEGFLNSLLKSEKYKNKEARNQKFQEQSFNLPAQLPKQQSSVPSLNRKKTIFTKDTKNITIMDKRILGQNIKKLPSDYLPQICKIVFDTLETREQYVIDIDTLPLKKVRQLQIYVEDCMQKIGQFDLQNTLRNQNDSEESSFVIMDDFD